MARGILIIDIENLKNEALVVHKFLIDWRFLIKTRLGLHDAGPDICSNAELMILELVGEKEKQVELTRKLNLLDRVFAKLIDLPFGKGEG